MNKIGFYRDNSKNLLVQNLKVSDLAKKYGTPLFVYDANLIENISSGKIMI